MRVGLLSLEESSIFTLLVQAQTANNSNDENTLHGDDAQPISGTSQSATEDCMRGVADIFATAHRRDQRLQDVPITISAATGPSLSNTGITRTAQIQSVVPNLAVGVAGQWAQLSGHATAKVTKILRAINRSLGRGRKYLRRNALPLTTICWEGF